MNRKIVVTVIVFITVLAVLAAALYQSLQSSKFLSLILAKGINRFWQEGNVSDLNFEGPVGLSFRVISIPALSGKVSFNHKMISFHGNGIQCWDWNQFLRPAGHFRIFIEGLNLETAGATIENIFSIVDVSVGKDKSSVFKGRVSARRITSEPYVARRLTGIFTGNDKQIEFNDLRCDFFGGKVEGTAQVFFNKKIIYEAVLNLKEVSVNKLKDVNPSFFSQIQGKLNGTVSLRGDEKGLRYVKSSLDMLPGGSMRAALLSFVADKIPAIAQQRDQLEQLIKENKDMVLKKAHLTIESISDNHLQGQLDIVPQNIILNLRFPLDINIDGGLESVFFQMNEIIKYLRN